MEIIIGPVVSLIVQLLKQRFTSQWQTLGILLVLSLAAAGLYTVLEAVGYWETIANILVMAEPSTPSSFSCLRANSAKSDRTEDLIV
jgi:hypothetical protein